MRKSGTVPELTQFKVGEKGRIVIPAEFREALGLKTGDRVTLEVVDDQIMISTFESRLKRTQERLSKLGRPGDSWTDELIAERRAEATREEEEVGHCWNEKRARE